MIVINRIKYKITNLKRGTSNNEAISKFVMPYY